MPEIKHTFTAGKMNKDLDERLVRNGEYRNALNIQVRTTDGDGSGTGDAGTVQNIEGNMRTGVAYSIAGYNGNRTKFIGNVNDESKDKAYFFSAAPIPEGGLIDGISVSEIKDGGERIWVDSIIEVDTSPLTSEEVQSETIDNNQAVFVDRFGITCTWEEAGSPTPELVEPNPGNEGYNYQTPTIGYYFTLQVADASKYRIGMRVYAQGQTGIHLLFADSEGTVPGPEITFIDYDQNLLYLSTEQSTLLTSQQFQLQASVMRFVYPERVLEFDHNKLITGLNIIDDFLFWTDSKHEGDEVIGTEPKKISISRSKAGTTAWNVHTKLFVRDKSNGDALTEITNVENLLTPDIKREHITVIRKKPVSPPTLYLSKTERSGNVEFYIDYGLNWNTNGNETGQPPVVGATRLIVIEEELGADVRINDVLIFTTSSLEDDEFTQTPVKVTVSVIDTDVNDNPELFEVRLMEVDPALLFNENGPWQVTLVQKKPLFETKFGRFAYRYKYEDGEYSAFSPWSELAFLPGTFLYTPSKGYNKGMVNNVRELIIKDFIPNDSVRPSDVKTIDILWKTTDNANVYLIKSITREINSEWENFTDPVEPNVYATDNTGSLTITSEIIERAIPSNQILRGWDNVPRKAVAQEITGNRLIYGNYIQGYDINVPIGLKQSIESGVIVGLKGTKSVKTLRNYKWGMVFGDKYGRETPVISSGYATGTFNEGDVLTGDISVPKELARFSNRFKLQQTWDTINYEPLEWMEYVKYYVKETSAEYYNLIMDRWYDAEDGNIWLSFPSVDRNKVDEETYLILKNQHGSQTPISGEGRYRVVAIENEAPDFIKTDKRRHEPVEFHQQVAHLENPLNNEVYTNNGANVVGETTTAPDRLANTKHLWPHALWDTNAFGINNNFQKEDFIPTANVINVVRLVASYQPGGSGTKMYKAYTDWKTATKILTRSGPWDINENDIKCGAILKDEGYSITEANLYWKIKAELPTALATDLANNAGNITFPFTYDGNIVDNPYYIRYELEIETRVVENKPQFDGRFFVKVEADALIRENLLGAQDGGWVSEGAFDIAYIANQDTNPAVNGNNASYSWPSDAVFDSVESEFGVNDTLTENFWNWWWNQGIDGNANRTTSIFLDEAPIANISTEYDDFALSLVPSGISPTQDPVGDDWVTIDLQQQWLQDHSDTALAEELNLETNVNGVYQPFGFHNFGNWDENGNFEDSGLKITHLIFSTVNSSTDGWSNGANIQFSSRIQTEGQLFRFVNDPNPDNIYKIMNPTLIPEEPYEINLTDVGFGDVDYYDDIYPTFNEFLGPQGSNISNKNYPTGDVLDNLSKRTSTIIQVCKLDPETGATDIGEGIDIYEWDPRGQVQHNGIGSFQIEFVRKGTNTDLQDDDVVTNNACWETEPKKDINVDIYYEATGSIPMKLNTDGNTQVFTGAANTRELASKVVHSRRILLDNTVEKQIIDSSSYCRTAFNHSTIRILKQKNPEQGIHPVWGDDRPLGVTTTANPNTAVGLAIGDEISFQHKNGLTTTSKVVDHMASHIDDNQYFGSSDYETAIPSQRITGSGYGQAGLLGDAENDDLVDSNWQMTIVVTAAEMYPYEPQTGDEVIGISTTFPDEGEQISERGSFICDVQYVSNIWYISINRLFASIKSGDDNVNQQIPGSFTFVRVGGMYRLDENTWPYAIKPAWFNCYSFGNGVESDRIRDDFNAPQIENGFKASSTFLEYGEEHIGSGLIHSGLYNAVSSVNSLNEFNMAEKITKNLNPAYGSIQALKTRDTNLLTFAEDKVLTVLANKDAVYNADGNPQLIATNRVLGTATPFIGDYGISRNPESLAWDQFRTYFTDKQRGAVLRLSNDGLTPISSVGMTTYFRENLKLCDYLIGTFDGVNGEYNLTLKPKPQYIGHTATVSFNEGSKGWVSFKSFIPSCGGTISGKYLTTKFDQNIDSIGVFEHYIPDSNTHFRNSFYNMIYFSTIDIVFNDMPDVVKSFKTLSYEGSQSRTNRSYDILQSETFEDVEGNLIPTFDGEYYNLEPKKGWYLQNFNTDMQSGTIAEFINKENKWFNYLRGKEIIFTSDVDTEEFSVQGIGFPSSAYYDAGENNEGVIIVQDEVEEEEIENDNDNDNVPDEDDNDDDNDGIEDDDDSDPLGDDDTTQEGEGDNGDSDTFNDLGEAVEPTAPVYANYSPFGAFGLSPTYPMQAYAYVSKYEFWPVNDMTMQNTGIAQNGINVFTGQSIINSTDYITDTDTIQVGSTQLANESLYGFQYVCIRVHEGMPSWGGNIPNGYGGAYDGIAIYNVTVQGNEIATPYNTSPATSSAGQFNTFEFPIAYYGVGGDIVQWDGDIQQQVISLEQSDLMPGAVGQLKLPYGSWTITVVDYYGETVSIDINGGYTPPS